MLAEYLTFRGFRVTEAAHGAEAMATAQRVRPDVILMDLSLPGMDGWEATRQLKSDPLTQATIIVAVTAHAFPPEREKARAAGCDGFIVKPYDLTSLADALTDIRALGPAALARMMPSSVSAAESG
jgi:CheY-like chemotaxis protein